MFLIPSQFIAILFEIGLQTAPENALKRCIFRLASAHFKSKRLYVQKGDVSKHTSVRAWPLIPLDETAYIAISSKGTPGLARGDDVF